MCICSSTKPSARKLTTSFGNQRRTCQMLFCLGQWPAEPDFWVWSGSLSSVMFSEDFRNSATCAVLPATIVVVLVQSLYGFISYSLISALLYRNMCFTSKISMIKSYAICKSWAHIAMELWTSYMQLVNNSIHILFAFWTKTSQTQREGCLIGRVVWNWELFYLPCTNIVPYYLCSSNYLFIEAIMGLYGWSKNFWLYMC